MKQTKQYLDYLLKENKSMNETVNSFENKEINFVELETKAVENNMMTFHSFKKKIKIERLLNSQ